jgi:putative transposase
VSENQAAFPIATMCRLLGVSPSGYYAWKKRQPSRRARTDTALVAEIRAAHAASRGIYEAPRIHVDLAAKGFRVGRKRVARLMSAAGLAGVSRRKFVTTTVKGSDRQAPDLVDRNFTAERPNLLWVADITYIPTWAGFLCLAVLLDACSRRIVGWSMGSAGGRTKEWHQKGGQNPVRPDTLIPSPQPSTKPGQVQAICSAPLNTAH